MKPGRLLFILGVLCSQAGPADDAIPEYEMKATFLYNFAVFTEWPPDGGDTLNLCLLGQDRFGHALDNIEGKNINGRRLAVSRLSSLSNVGKCHVLFISDIEAARVRNMMDEVSGLPMLTVTDNARLPGAMIVIVPEGRRLTFDVNIDAIRRTRLSISSKLLRLARNAAINKSLAN